MGLRKRRNDGDPKPPERARERAPDPLSKLVRAAVAAARRDPQARPRDARHPGAAVDAGRRVRRRRRPPRLALGAAAAAAARLAAAQGRVPDRRGAGDAGARRRRGGARRGGRDGGRPVVGLPLDQRRQRRLRRRHPDGRPGAGDRRRPRRRGALVGARPDRRRSRRWRPCVALAGRPRAARLLVPLGDRGDRDRGADRRAEGSRRGIGGGRLRGREGDAPRRLLDRDRDRGRARRMRPAAAALPPATAAAERRTTKRRAAGGEARRPAARRSACPKFPAEPKGSSA